MGRIQLPQALAAAELPDLKYYGRGGELRTIYV
jgi:hypothetical protein